MASLVAAPKKPKAKAVSIWASEPDREMFTRVSTRAGESFSRVVRTLVKNYDTTGVATGLPKLTPIGKKAKKTKPKKAAAKSKKALAS